jgi:hypothetical protein
MKRLALISTAALLLAAQEPRTQAQETWRDWKEPDWRNVNGQTESVWGKDWSTFFGFVTKGPSPTKVKFAGYELAGNDFATTSFWLLDHWDSPKVVNSGEVILLRAKAKNVSENGLQILEYGTPCEPRANLAPDQAAEMEKAKQLCWESAQAKLEMIKKKLNADVSAKSEKQAADEKKRIETAQRVVKWQMDQAEKGYPSAQCSLGLRYLKGDGVPKDEKLGREWLEKAAAQGDGEAKAALAKLGPAESK